MARKQHEHVTVDPVARTGSADAVVVHGTGVNVDRVDTELPAAEVRSQHGGLDLPAVLAGTFAALGLLLALTSLAGAVLTVALDDLGEASLGAVVAGLVVLALALLFGGWVAGRSARYDGARNGLLAGLLFIVVAAVLAAIAAGNDEVRDLGLPSFSFGGGTAAAIAAGLVALVVVLAAAAIGGRLGAGWHRRVDSLLLHTRAGGVQPYPGGDR